MEEETEKEKFLVNNRDLIVKKNLTVTYSNSYNHSLQNSQIAENKRD
ncbi:MAG: hypothetical protein NY202_00660 [Mollicutes bacterium UO1]